MISSYARNAIVLGLLVAVGPFSIDMYLPALPAIALDLGASTASTQMTLTAFFVAFGLCQIVYGPLSDMLGRKPPLYVGLGLFVVGSVGCSMAASIEGLIAFRFIQGLGASAAMVIPRAIVRDMHTGIEATRLMATIMLVLSVSPILAPLLGSAFIVPLGWRAVFVAVTVIGVLCSVLLTLHLPETLPPQNRIKVSLGSVFGGFGQLLRHGRFMGLTFIGGLGMGSFFAFIASSAFIYTDHFGLTPMQYGLAFAVNAVGFIGASQFAAHLGQRFGMPRVILTAVSLYAGFAVLLFVMSLSGMDNLATLMSLLFLSFSCLGVVIPTTMVLALEEHGPIAGMASALGGTLQMLAGGVVIVIVSHFFDGTVLPMVTAIALCAIGAFLSTLVTLRGRELTAQPQAADSV